MIAVHLPAASDGARLVEALLIAAGAIAVPADPAEQQSYLDLSNSLGDGLDALPTPPTPPTGDGDAT